MKNNKKPSGPPAIRGIIMPSRWNEQGKPARIAIHTDDQKEYEIGFGGVGKELMNFTYKKVAVKGKLKEQLNGRSVLSVQQYQIQDDAIENSASKDQAA
jgi:hypothetical protein